MSREDVMNGRSRFGLGIIVLAAVIGIVMAGIWWTSHREGSYKGLAEQYPDTVALFIEVRELGQWMPPGESGGQTAYTERRGSDPMLQVLSQVWAATPPVKSVDLPDLLRMRPMAVGMWQEGKRYKGVAVIPLAPGQRSLLEKALKDKLGEGPVVATVEGVPLRKIESLSGKLDIHMGEILWGVSETRAVMATGVDEAKMVLAQQAKPLSADPAFLAAARKFPQDKGAYLFVRGSALANLKDLDRPASDGSHEEKPEKSENPLEEEKPQPVTPPQPPAPEGLVTKDGTPSSDEIGKVLMGFGKAGLEKVLSLDSIQSVSLWTAPPLNDEKGWQTAFWLGFNEAPKGIWRIAAEGSLRTPQIADRLPKDGLIYVWSGGKEPARIYQDFMGELQRSLPPDQMSWVRAGIGAAEGKLDLSFAKDLLPTLADEWCFVSSETKDSSKGGRAIFLTLRDSRRFEDLVSNKLAPQLGLKPGTQSGARIWTYSPGKEGFGSLNLLVTGGMAIITDRPDWALATGGDAGKAWKALADFKEKASGVLVLDPILWAKNNDVLVLGSCRSASDGIYASARFPGEPPSWTRKKPQDGLKEISGGEPRDPAVSGSL
jgi:hypothetical protein